MCIYALISVIWAVCCLSRKLRMKADGWFYISLSVVVGVIELPLLNCIEYLHTHLSSQQFLETSMVL